MGCLWAILYPAGRWKSKFCGREPQEEKLSTLSKTKVDVLQKEFPFLREIIPVDEFLSGKGKINLVFSEISVTVADSRALYFIPRSYWHEYSICSHDNKHIGSSLMRAYSIDANNQIIDSWEWNYEGQDAFFGILLSKPERPVKKLVLVDSYKWYEHIADYYERGLTTNVGKFSHLEYAVTVFKEPKQSFNQLKSESDLTSNVRIDDLLSISMAARLNTDAKKATDEIDKIKAEFKNRIGQSMWKHISASKSSGMKGQFGNTELLTLCSAGRVMLTFNRGKDNFTLVGDESDWKRTGVQSMHCTVIEAKEMVSEVIENWSPSKLLDDKKVWFG
jgi:hypothetical protein